MIRLRVNWYGWKWNINAWQQQQQQQPIHFSLIEKLKAKKVEVFLQWKNNTDANSMLFPLRAKLLTLSRYLHSQGSCFKRNLFLFHFVLLFEIQHQFLPFPVLGFIFSFAVQNGNGKFYLQVFCSSFFSFLACLGKLFSIVLHFQKKLWHCF